MRKKLRIVTRKSQLALAQANFVEQLLINRYPDLDIDIIGVSTQGDKTLDIPLAKIGGKGLFVKELEYFLLQNDADIAVHSMKDVPAYLPDDLMLGAILKREDPRDAIIVRAGGPCALQSLPRGSIIGTSSLRRQSQLLACCPNLEVKFLRGNVVTRINKLEQKEYDAIVLAVAGLQRLNFADKITSILSTEIMLPAVGQGALGIECRVDAQDVHAYLQPLIDQETSYCVAAERAMNAVLNGGCQAPIAGFAEYMDGKICIKGFVGTADGQKALFASRTGLVADVETLGKEVGEDLLEQGARDIISALKVGWHNNAQ